MSPEFFEFKYFYSIYEKSLHAQLKRNSPLCLHHTEKATHATMSKTEKLMNSARSVKT